MPGAELDLVLAGWLAETIVQSTALALVALLLDRFGERRIWPELRHALWVAVIVRLLVPPGVGLPVIADPPIALLSMGTVFPSSREALLSVSTGAPSGRGVVSALLVLWGAGALAAVGVRVSTACGRRAAQGAFLVALPESELESEVTSLSRLLGLRTVPRISVDPTLDSAESRGLLSPTIVLPASYLRVLGRPQLRAVLAHELGHIRRGDLWLDLLFELARCIHWYLPIAHLAAARARRLREHGCDRLACEILGSRMEYRRTLVGLALHAPEATSPFGELSFGAAPFLRPRANVLSRADWLARRSRFRERSSSVAALATLLFSLACAAPRVDRARVPSRTAHPLDISRAASQEEESARQTLLEAARGGRPGSLRLHAAARRLSHAPS